MDLLRKIAAGKIDPVYVLYGAEPAATRAVVQALRKLILPPDDPIAQAMAAFNHERFDGADVGSAAAVLSACAQVPMMSKWRLVELANPEDIGKGPDAESTAAAAIDALAAYIKVPCPSTVLVISSSGIDGRSKLVTACKVGGYAHKFEALAGDSDAIGFVVAQAQERGRRIERDAAAAMVAAVGVGRSALQVALEQALLHAGEGSVRIADVQATAAHTREAAVFELTDAVGQGNASKALAVLARMFAAGEDDREAVARLFGLLVKQIRLIFTAKCHPGQTSQRTGLPPFVAGKIEAQARRFSEASLRTAYAGLVRLDEDLKGRSVVAAKSPHLAFQRWILDVCASLPGVEARA